MKLMLPYSEAGIRNNEAFRSRPSEFRPEACNFIKKETLAQVFSCEFCQISKSTLLQNTYGRLLLLIADLFTIFQSSG